jgi:hypothetical protein
VVADEIHNLARQCKETVRAAQNTSAESARATSAMTEAVNDCGHEFGRNNREKTMSLEEEPMANICEARYAFR